MRNKNVFLVLQMVCVLLLKSTRTAQTKRRGGGVLAGKRPTCRIRRYYTYLQEKNSNAVIVLSNKYTTVNSMLNDDSITAAAEAIRILLSGLRHPRL